MYRKQTRLDLATVEQIRLIEQPKILDAITNQAPRLSIDTRWILRPALALSLVALLILGIWMSSPSTPTPPSDYTIDDVYQRLIEYRTALADVDIDAMTPSLASVMWEEPDSSPLRFLSSMTKTYSRDELEAIYATQTNRHSLGQYSEAYFEATHFLDIAIQLIEDNQDIPLDVFKTVDRDTYGYNRFQYLYYGNDYIVIKAQNNEDGMITDRTGFKIGRTNDKVEITTIHYAFEFDDWLVDDIEETNFNYFEFTEDTEVTYINSLNDHFDIHYSSLVDDISVTVSRGGDVVEGPSEGLSGDVISVYNAPDQYQFTVQFAGEELLSEQYIFFDDQGMYLYYMDDDITDNQVMLLWNLMRADGWDEIVVVSSDGYGYREEGLYFEGTRLDMDGLLSVYYTDTAVGVNYRKTIEGPITDDILRLANTPLTWQDDTLTMDHLRTFFVTDLASAREDADVFDFDVFTDDLKTALYHRVDADIRIVLD
jgi:hypothetical protein